MTAVPTQVGPVRATGWLVGFLIALVACGGAVVWAFSYPGVPMSVLVVALLLGLAVVPLGVRLAWRPGPLGIALGSTVLVVAAVSVLIGTGAPKQVRFAASQDAFAAVVAGLPVPTDVTDRSSWADFPGACPAAIGSYTIGECHGFEAGYIFLQYDDAVTDVSGIAYLPSGPSRYEDGRIDSGLTQLDGPWWSWTCNC